MQNVHAAQAIPRTPSQSVNRKIDKAMKKIERRISIEVLDKEGEE